MTGVAVGFFPCSVLAPRQTLACGVDLTMGPLSKLLLVQMRDKSFSPAD